MFLVVGVERDVVDDVVRLVEHGRLPRPERRHRRMRAAAGHELEVGVGLAHGPRRLGGEPAVLRCGLVSRLPRSVHLVAEAPQPDGVGIGSTVVDALVRQRRARGVVGVLQQVERLGDAAGAEVDGHHRLDTGPTGPLDELVDTDLVGLGAAPGEVAPHRTAITRPDTVLPAVVGDEVAARIAHHRDAELLRQGDDVAAEAILVGRGVAGLVDPGVHATSEVLDERAEQSALDRGDARRGIDHDTGGLGPFMAAHDCDLRWLRSPRSDCERSQRSRQPPRSRPERVVCSSSSAPEQRHPSAQRPHRANPCSSGVARPPGHRIRVAGGGGAVGHRSTR